MSKVESTLSPEEKSKYRLIGGTMIGGIILFVVGIAGSHTNVLIGLLSTLGAGVFVAGLIALPFEKRRSSKIKSGIDSSD